MNTKTLEELKKHRNLRNMELAGFQINIGSDETPIFKAIGEDEWEVKDLGREAWQEVMLEMFLLRKAVPKMKHEEVYAAALEEWGLACPHNWDFNGYPRECRICRVIEVLNGQGPYRPHGTFPNPSITIKCLTS